MNINSTEQLQGASVKADERSPHQNCLCDRTGSTEYTYPTMLKPRDVLLSSSRRSGSKEDQVTAVRRTSDDYVPMAGSVLFGVSNASIPLLLRRIYMRGDRNASLLGGGGGGFVALALLLVGLSLSL